MAPRRISCRKAVERDDIHMLTSRLVENHRLLFDEHKKAGRFVDVKFSDDRNSNLCRIGESSVTKKRQQRGFPLYLAKIVTYIHLKSFEKLMNHDDFSLELADVDNCQVCKSRKLKQLKTFKAITTAKCLKPKYNKR